MSTRLLMIRHGESVANAEERFTHHDDEPLTPLGIQQAQATGRLIREHRSPVALYSSTFLRARQTAEEIGRQVGLPSAAIEGIQEQSFGELRGQPWTSFFAHWSEQVAGDPQLRWKIKAPGGESQRDVLERALPALEDLASHHASQEIAIVAHGGVLAAVRAHLEGAFDPQRGPTPNAGGYAVEVRSARWLVRPLLGFEQSER